jgi:hypothetical protein
VTIAETHDCSNSTAALLFGTMGFGPELKDWSPESPFAQMFNRAFRQVIYNMAATFDIDLVDVKWSCDVIKAAPGILLPKIQAPFRRRFTG